MNYAQIKPCDVANGPGIRVSLFVSGCTHHCKGCFNEVAWDFQYGKQFTDETMVQLLESLSPDYIAGLTLLGGEPFEQINQRGLLPFVRKVRELYPEKSIWCYTGYDFEKDILARMYEQWPETRELISNIDVLVDGKFVEEQKNLSLRFRGSSNQRIILVKESIKQGEIVLWDEK
jgi:anaerobic ribonucleoside-triphosphate reductase activating protein